MNTNIKLIKQHTIIDVSRIHSRFERLNYNPKLNINIMADKAQELKASGNKAFQAGNFEEAVKLFTEAIAINPNDHVFYSNRSGAYASLKNYNKALEDANKCVQINPKWAKGYQRKGHAEFYLNQVPQAVQTYKKGLELEPDNSSLKEGLATAEARLAAGEDDLGFDLNSMLKNPQAMQVMMKLMNHPDTKGLFEDPSFLPIMQAIMQNPNPAVLAKLAQKDPRVKKLVEVLQSTSAEEAAFAKNFGQQQQPQAPSGSKMEQQVPKPQKKSEPKKAEPPKPKQPATASPAEQWKAKGNEAYTKKNFDEALDCYNEAIKLNPNEVLYYSNKAAVYIELNMFEKALSAVEEGLKFIDEGIVKDYVKKAKLFARKGSVLAKMERFDDAIAAYQKSLIEDSKQTTKDELTKVKKLKKDFQAKAYIDPSKAEQHNQKGNTLFKQGKYPDSLKEYEQATRRNPNVAKYFSNMGTVYIKLMEFVRARDCLDKALQIDPNYVKAYAKKGDCHFFLKEYHKAMEVYEKGMKIQPDNEACISGIKKTQMAIITSSDKEGQEERARHAMADPEIQGILKSPQIQNVLNDLQNDPKSAAKAFQNPDIAQKLNKLIASGILRMG